MALAITSITLHMTEDERIVGAVPQNLCAPLRSPWPPIGLQVHVRKSLAWQENGVRADFFAFGGATRGLAERVYECVSLYAGVGEQLGLACAADQEFQCWSIVSPEGIYEPLQKEMASRAIAELEAYYVLGISHSLLNLAARHAALNRGVRAEFLNKLKTDFPPHSDRRRDWPPATSVGRIVEILKPLNDPLASDVLEVVRTYIASPEYKALDDLRGTNFHRWRLQTAGITGAARGPIGQTTSGGGMSLSVYGGRRIGKDVPAEFATDGYKIVRAALDPLPAVMDELEAAADKLLHRETDLKPKPSAPAK